jgi:hypothetical protein
MLLSWDFGIADAGCDPFTCDKIVVNPDIAFHRACLAIGQNPSVERLRRDSHGAPGGLTGAENLAARRMRSACRDAPVLSKMWARLVRRRRDRNAMLVGHHGIPGEHALKRAHFGGRLLSHFDRIVLS